MLRCTARIASTIDLRLFRLPSEVSSLSSSRADQAALERELAVRRHPSRRPATPSGCASARPRARAPRSASRIDRAEVRPAALRRGRRAANSAADSESRRLRRRTAAPFELPSMKSITPEMRRPDRLLHAAAVGVDRHREDVRVRAPVPAEHPADLRQRPVLVAAAEQQLGRAEASRGQKHARGRALLRESGACRECGRTRRGTPCRAARCARRRAAAARRRRAVRPAGCS